MIYQFNLDEKDYHTHLLFTVSKSSSAIKMRNRVRFLMTLSMMIFAFIAYGNGSTGQALYFIFLTLVSFFLLPLYTRWSYKKTYLKHVRKYYADRMSETTGVEITENHILITDSQGESTLSFDEIEAVNELNDYLFLKLTRGTSIIFPLNKLENRTALEQELHQLAEKIKISWNDEKSWTWK